ncbi:hypothetical protein BZK37_18180 [Enterococcus casseliflavus]|nr:hypothetical protein BZK37_18180 [Enterococcus casseliflavus]
MPIYGNGLNKRDWLYDEDFCRAIFIILESGKTGEIYNVSAHEEIDNLTLVKKLCHGNIKDRITWLETKNKPRTRVN